MRVCPFIRSSAIPVGTLNSSRVPRRDRVLAGQQTDLKRWVMANERLDEGRLTTKSNLSVPKF